jgi:G6PDH family F420-dependent oxidoreductase
MTRFGYFLSSEEFSPLELVDQARMAEDAGFEALWISDHYHPWTDAQGHSGFVWGTIGALSQVTSLPITTAVTCPSFRLHPAIIAQAAATAAVQTRGRFTLGVGSGEALNEHILGQVWPPTKVRLDMLAEAVEVIRALWTGRRISHQGRYFTVDNARVYTLPDRPPGIYVSGFGPRSAELAGRIGDGFVTTKPDRELVRAFREAGGTAKPTQAGFKVCWSPDRDQAVKLATERWAVEALPGELNQVLPQPAHFEQAASLVTDTMVAAQVPCGDDVEAHVNAARAYLNAGFDEVYVNQIGPNQRGFFDFWRREVLPELR